MLSGVYAKQFLSCQVTWSPGCKILQTLFALFFSAFISINFRGTNGVMSCNTFVLAITWIPRSLV